MSSLVPGNPAVFPNNITVPDNGDSRDASTVAIPLGGLADRTANLGFYRDRMLPMFGHWVTMSATTNVDVVKFNPATRDWYGMSTNTADKFQRTKDYTTWPGTTEITGAPLIMTPAKPGDFEFNASGHGVLVCNSDEILLEYNGSAWQKIPLYTGGAFQPSGNPRCVSVKYSPTPTRWAVAFNPSGGANPPYVYTSTNRVTWSAGVALPFPNNTEVKLGSNGGGTLVAVGRTIGSANIHFSRSTDGGVTWSAVQTIASGLTTSVVIPQIEPVWNGLEWFAVAFDNSTSKLYHSVDGLTWSLLKAFTAFPIQSLAAIGKVLVAGASNGDMAASTDNGATWVYVPRRFPSAALANINYTGALLVASGGATVMVASTGLSLVAATVP